jgi:hypothetical protein
MNIKIQGFIYNDLFDLWLIYVLLYEYDLFAEKKWMIFSKECKYGFTYWDGLLVLNSVW